MSLSLLKLQSLGPKEDFDVLSKWIDCASWYSPPVNRLPPTDSVTCDNHHASSVVPNPGSLAQKSNISFPPNFLKWLKKIWWFPAVPYLSRGSLICEAVCEQATLGCFLLPYSPATSSRWAFMSDAPSGHGVCESLGKSNNLQPTAIVAFFISGVRALHTIHACTFTDLIQTKSKAYWGAQLRKYKCVDISTCWLLQVVWHTVYFDYWYWLQKLQWMKD